MLPKVVYKKILKGIQHLKNQNEQDRKENPGLLAMDWDAAIKRIIEAEMRIGKLRTSDAATQETINYLDSQGIVKKTPWGVYMPGNEPTKTAIEAEAKRVINLLK